MRSLCVDWASAVDGIEHTYDVQKATLAVLFGMINSSHRRPHNVVEKWKLLEYFTSVPDDSQSLRRCIDNPEFMEVIKNVDNPAATFLCLAILWLKYKELIPEVWEQLETVTKVAQGRRRTDLDMYLSVMNLKLGKTEGALTQYNTRSTDPVAIALRTKINNLQQARASLVTLKRGSCLWFTISCLSVCITFLSISSLFCVISLSIFHSMSFCFKQLEQITIGTDHSVEFCLNILTYSVHCMHILDQLLSVPI